MASAQEKAPEKAAEKAPALSPDAEFQLKPAGDFSKSADALLEAPALASASAEVDRLMAGEKGARAVGDHASCTRLVLAALDACWRAKDTALLVATLSSLARKRGGAKATLTEAVRACMAYLAQLRERGAPEAERLTLITAMRTVTDGKVRGGMRG